LQKFEETPPTQTSTPHPQQKKQIEPPHILQKFEETPPTQTSTPQKARLMNNSKLESLCKRGEVDLALRAFVFMRERNQMPNSTTYRILRDGLNQKLFLKGVATTETLSKLNSIVNALKQNIAKFELFTQTIDAKIYGIDDKLFLLLKSLQMQPRTESKVQINKSLQQNEEQSIPLDEEQSIQQNEQKSIQPEQK